MLDFILHMDSAQVFTLFAAGTFVVFIVSALAALVDFKEHSDTLGSAALLAILLELSYLVRSGAPGPMGIGETTWMIGGDLLALAIMVYWLATRVRWWKFVMAFLFVLGLVVHYAALNEWYAGQDFRYTSILYLNLIGALQLLVNATPGVRCVAGLLRSWVHGDRRRAVRVHHGLSR
jgi:hypothetical protein